jgi:hypothetical protein
LRPAGSAVAAAASLANTSSTSMFTHASLERCSKHF